MCLTRKASFPRHIHTHCKERKEVERKKGRKKNRFDVTCSHFSLEKKPMTRRMKEGLDWLTLVRKKGTKRKGEHIGRKNKLEERMHWKKEWREENKLTAETTSSILKPSNLPIPELTMCKLYSWIHLDCNYNRVEGKVWRKKEGMRRKKESGERREWEERMNPNIFIVTCLP